MTMTEDITVRIEALKLVKEWSIGLIVVQSGAVAVIGTLLNQPPTGWFLVLVIALFISLIASIWFGAVSVVGTIPFIVQKLPENPKCDIYEHKGGIGKFTLGQQCSYQERLFIISLLLFAVTVTLRPSSKSEAVVLQQPVQVQIIGGGSPPDISKTQERHP